MIKNAQFLRKNRLGAPSLEGYKIANPLGVPKPSLIPQPKNNPGAGPGLES
jgi:hypothetical protein